MAAILLYSAFVLVLLAAAPAIWIWCVLHLVNRVPIVPREPRRAVPWGLADLLLAFVLLVGVSMVLGLVMRELGWMQPAKVELAETAAEEDQPPSAEIEPAKAETAPAEKADKKKPDKQQTLDQGRRLIAGDSVVKLLVAVLLIAAIGCRFWPTAADWGWTLQHWQYDIVLGVCTFLAIYAPMIAVQATLVFVFKWKYEHPLIDIVKETKDVPFFVLAGIAAVVIAPLFEEFIFRGLLQGWLEKLFSGSSSAFSVLFGGVEQPEAIAVSDQSTEIDVSNQPAISSPGVIDLSPYASPQPDQNALGQQPVGSGCVSPGNFDWLAIVGSMVVFSLLHFNQGPAWITLLVFGAAIGFVYQRTHRIWPGIIAHFLLNSVTMVGLWIQVFIGIPGQ